jgi:hypothetical protein
LEENIMKGIFLTVLVALFALGTLFVVGCDEETGDGSVCVRACDRWVNQCGRWNWDDCMTQCTAEGDWDDYADCVEVAPCDMLDAVCNDF